MIEKRPRGRPKTGVKKRQAWLTDEHWAKAKSIGEGRPSVGLQRALDKHKDVE